ncbi:MAG: A24 family peptidase [Actinomycetota bacterium]|nr:A24 family peptidase [Actinomycetota bacterium]
MLSPVRALPGVDTLARVAATCAVGVAVEAVMLWRFGWTLPLGAYASFAAVGTVVSATDLAARRIPNRVVLPGLVAALVLLGVASAIPGAWWPLARAGIAMVVLAGFYLALGLAFPSGMGMGDVKWAAVVGLLLGWLGWPAVVTGTLLAFAAAALGVLVLRLATPRRGRLVLPMAPCTSAGALIAIWTLR